MKWYEVDKKRLVLEYQKVNNKYPEFILCIYKDCLSWEGTIYFNFKDEKLAPLKIRVICEDAFPINAPKVYPIDSDIPEELVGHEWHRWPDGKICYGNPKDWKPDYFIVDVISKVESWYHNYLLLRMKVIDKFPDVGRAIIPE